MITPPPIQTNLVESDGKLSRVWTLWLQKLVIFSNSGSGVTGSFTTADAKTVTVVDGIITSIL